MDDYLAYEQDLFGPRRRRNRLSALAGLGGGESRAQYPAFSPDEMTELTSSYLDKGVNLLQYVGETLDKPGRAIRGTIGGIIDTLQGKENPEWGGSLLNLLPFSDAMGLTDPKAGVEGRDILEKLGAPENQEGFFNSPSDAAWDVAGFATEVLLDPLTYTGIGKLTKEGVRATRLGAEAAKAASKAGKILPDVIKPLNQAVRSGERSLLSIGLPEFLGGATAHWTGDSAGAVADVLNAVTEPIARSRPGRTLSRLFDYDKANMGSELGQELAPKYTMLKRELKADALTPAYSELDRLARADALTPEAIDLMRQGAEGVAEAVPLNMKDAYLAGVESQARQKGYVDALSTRGHDTAALSDSAVNYANRQHYRDVPGVTRELYDVVTGKPRLATHGRLDELKDVAGGTVQINDIVNGKLKDAAGRTIWDMKEDEGVDFLKQFYTGIDPDEAAKRAQKFYNRVQSYDQAKYDIRLAGPDAKRLFNGNVLQDEATSVASKINKITHTDFVHEMAARGSRSEAELIREFGGIPADMVEMNDALTKLGVNHKGKGLERTQGFMQQLGIDPLAGGGKRFIPREVYNDMNRLAQLWRQPEELSGIARVFDAFQNLWKTTMTTPFLSFHMRNGLGGAYYNWASGATKNPYGAITPTAVAFNAVKKGHDVPENILRDITKAAPEFPVGSTSDLLGEAYAHGAIGAGGTATADVGSTAAQQLETIGGQPARKPMSIWESLKQGVSNAVEEGKQTFDDITRPKVRPTQSRQDLVAEDAIIGKTVPSKTGNAKRSAMYSDLVNAGAPEDFAARRTARKFGDPDPSRALGELTAPDGAILGERQMSMSDNRARIDHYESLRKQGLSAEDAVTQTRAKFNDPSVAPALPRTLEPAGRVKTAVGAVVGAADTAASLGRKVGNTIEESLRLGHYISQRLRGMSPSEAAASVRKWYFNYCVDEETEILTQRGWLRWNELRTGDVALTINPDTRVTEWQPVIRVNTFDSPGVMHVWKNTRLDAMTTSNHRWLADGSGVRGGPAIKNSTHHFCTTEEAETTGKRLIACGDCGVGAESQEFDDGLVEILGWIISEGHFAKDGSIKIAQSEKHNPHHVEKIRDLLAPYNVQNVRGLGVAEYAQDCGWGKIVTFHIKPLLAEFIRTLIPNKQLPVSLLTRLTKPQLAILYDALMSGDGHITDSGFSSWAQKDQGRIDSFQALCAMLGRRTYSRMTGGRTETSTVSVYQNCHIYTSELHSHTVPYDGIVWCPTTANGTWMARRHGCTYFTGNSELTEFERNVMRRVFPFFCVPEDSECLTREGWKRYDQVRVGEDILTYNTESDSTEWQECLEVASFRHDQDLMVLENSYHKLRFTPNHRWAVRTNGCTIKRPYGEYTYPARVKVVTGEELNTNHNIVCAAPILDRADDASFLTPEQATLLGWLVTDGYTRWKGPSIEAVIYQSPKKFLAEVSAVAGGKPRKPHPDTGVVAVPVLHHRAKAIEWSLKPENLSWTVCHLSREAAQAMYDAMYMADGTVSPKRSGDFFAATKPHVRDAFLILCAMLGKRTGFGDRGVNVNEATSLKVAGMKRRMEHYSGVVWCPRTKNGTWVMRQGRLVTITGNTWSRKNIPLVLGELLQNPGGRLAQSVRAANESRDPKTYIPDWVGGGGPVIKVNDQGRFITSLGLPFESVFNWDVSPAPGATIQRNLEGTVAAMNPALKLGYSLTSGRDPLSGRELRDLYKYPTSNTLANATIANLPGSRFVSDFRRISDPRKTPFDKVLGSISGIKITDVSGGLEGAREFEMGKVMEEIMRRDPELRSKLSFYLDPAAREKGPSPSVIELLRIQATLNKRSRERLAEKRRAEAAGPAAP